MNDFRVDDFLRGIEVRDLEHPHRLDSRDENVFSLAGHAGTA